MDEELKTKAGKERLYDIRIESLNDGAYIDPFSPTASHKLSENDIVEKIADYCGCTATVILITPTEVYCANAGDSRTVYGSYLGKAFKNLSEDHKPDNPEEKMRIKAAGGFVSNNRI